MKYVFCSICKNKSQKECESGKAQNVTKSKYAKINLKKSANQEKHKLSQKATSLAQKPSTIQVMCIKKRVS